MSCDGQGCCRSADYLSQACTERVAIAIACSACCHDRVLCTQTIRLSTESTMFAFSMRSFDSIEYCVCSTGRWTSFMFFHFLKCIEILLVHATLKCKIYSTETVEFIHYFTKSKQNMNTVWKLWKHSYAQTQRSLTPKIRVLQFMPFVFSILAYTILKLCITSTYLLLT